MSSDQDKAPETGADDRPTREGAGAEIGLDEDANTFEPEEDPGAAG